MMVSLLYFVFEVLVLYIQRLFMLYIYRFIMCYKRWTNFDELQWYCAWAVRCAITVLPFTDTIACLVYLITVIIGFQQLHYKVNEDDRCVIVCAEIVGGQLTPPDRVSFSFITENITAISKLLN